MICFCENIFGLEMFVFVSNGKFSCLFYNFQAGIEGRTAKCIITSRGEKGAASRTSRTSLPGDKGPFPRDKAKKGRDASGASAGAEALIAAPIMLNYECFRNSEFR